MKGEEEGSQQQEQHNCKFDCNDETLCADTHRPPDTNSIRRKPTPPHSQPSCAAHPTGTRTSDTHRNTCWRAGCDRHKGNRSTRPSTRSPPAGGAAPVNAPGQEPDPSGHDMAAVKARRMRTRNRRSKAYNPCQNIEK